MIFFRKLDVVVIVYIHMLLFVHLSIHLISASLRAFFWQELKLKTLRLIQMCGTTDLLTLTNDIHSKTYRPLLCHKVVEFEYKILLFLVPFRDH